MSEDYLWRPSREQAAAANSMIFAHAHGVDSYDALVRRSIDEIEWFWDEVVKHLRLDFAKPYQAVLDDRDGIAWTRWFPGGELNLCWNCIDRHASSGRDAIRYEDEGGNHGVLSYAELRREVGGTAGALEQLGVRRGNRVGLLMPMTPEAVIAFYAIVRLGAVAVPMFSGFSAPAVATRLRDAQASVLITAASTVRRGRVLTLGQTAAAAVRDAPSVKAVVVVDKPGQRVAPARQQADCSWISWWDLPRRDLGATVLPSEHPLMVCYTSGTTGRPKGAVHVHGGFLVKTAQEVHFQADLKEGDALFWLSDMGWIMAPWAIVGAHANGQTLVLYDGAPDVPDTDRLWSLTERHEITFLGLSPTLVRSLRANRSSAAGHDISTLRLFGSAGEPWNAEPYRWLFEQVGGGQRPIINLSGGTEVGSSFLSADISIPLRACSLGRPALGMAMAVYDAAGRPAVRGRVGELVCTKPWPSMTRGLWGDADRYIETYWSRWPGVWVHGDWASVSVEGSWFLHGRSDDTLNVAGKRIGAAEYEGVLADHPAVLEACAIGLPHDLKGESAHCLVVLRRAAEPSDPLRGELHRLLEDHLGKPFRAARIHFVARLPKTRSGKVMRGAIKSALMGDELGDLSALEDGTALEEIRAVARIEPARVPMDTKYDVPGGKRGNDPDPERADGTDHDDQSRGRDRVPHPVRDPGG